MATSKKNAKATRKFEKNHLKGVLEKRKASAKVKQRAILQEKKKSRKAKDADFTKGPAAEAGAGPAATTKKNLKVADMSVDDFFQGGFDEIINGDDKKSKATKSTKAAAAAKSLGKRKRDGSAATRDESDDDDDDDNSSHASDDSEEGDVGMSKQAMDDLAKKDPEFYKFLQENDPEALDFDLDADLAEVDDLSADESSSSSSADEDDQQQPNKKRKKTASKEDNDDKTSSNKKKTKIDSEDELTPELIAKWRKLMVETHSLRASRQVVLAFRCAAHLNEIDDEESARLPRYKISNPTAYNDILMLALKEIPAVMAHHIPVKESASGKVYVQTESKKFKTLSLLIKTYVASIMHLLTTLSDAKTLNLTLSGLLPIVPYLLSFRKLLRVVVRTVVGYWSQPASAETTRITAFLVLRRLTVVGDRTLREIVLKSTLR